VRDRERKEEFLYTRPVQYLALVNKMWNIYDHKKKLTIYS